MSLFDFLNFNKNNVLNEIEGNNLLKGVKTNTPEYAESMGVNYQPKPGIYDRIINGLLGTPTKPNDTVTMSTDENGNPMINSTVENNPRQGGILRDIAAGYRENRDNGFSLDNWGKNKNIAQRIGEGLGSAARIAESPLGRSLLVGAAVGLTGGNPLQMLAYGSQTGALNQANRTADRLYRDALAQEGIDAGNLNGYVNKDMFGSMLTAKQLRDNAEYRNLMLSNQQEQNRIMNQLRADQLDFQRQKETSDRAFQNAQLGLGYAKLNADNLERYAKLAEKEQEKANEYQDVENQLKAFENTFKKANNPYRYRAFGGASNALNTLSPNEANFNAQRTLLFNQIARKLGGEKGVLSDADIKRVEAALPSLSDTYEQKVAKMKGIYNLLDIKKGNFDGGKQVGKYKVTVK